jgi:hypothetical protein
VYDNTNVQNSVNLNAEFASDVDGCKAACDSAAGCTAFGYNTQNKTCQLKQGNYARETNGFRYTSVYDPNQQFYMKRVLTKIGNRYLQWPGAFPSKGGPDREYAAYEKYAPDNSTELFIANNIPLADCKKMCNNMDGCNVIHSDGSWCSLYKVDWAKDVLRYDDRTSFKSYVTGGAGPYDLTKYTPYTVVYNSYSNLDFPNLTPLHETNGIFELDCRFSCEAIPNCDIYTWNEPNTCKYYNTQGAYPTLSNSTRYWNIKNKLIPNLKTLPDVDTPIGSKVPPLQLQK